MAIKIDIKESGEMVKAMEMGPIEDLNGMSMMANESMR